MDLFFNVERTGTNVVITFLCQLKRTEYDKFENVLRNIARGRGGGLSG
jgi:hypothetical protein